MYSTCALGQHHKSDEGNKDRSFLVRWFYKYYFFFGYLCVGAEFTFILAFVMQYAEATYIPILKLILLMVLPGCILKQFVNVAQLTSACYMVASRDATEKSKDK